jgi:signal peptidase I
MTLGGKLFGISLNVFELTKYVVLIVVAAILVVVFLGLPMAVSGQSMEPNFHDKEIVLIQRLSYSGNRTVKRGDVVAAKFPADPEKTRLIKRVIGLPGEKVSIQDNHYYINGELLNEKYDLILGDPPYVPIVETTLKDGEYFLSGDNRPGSSDSRLWGPVQRSDIQGKVSFIIYPIRELQYIVPTD